ncbi:conserved protein of unknown function [Blastococcus saxobsidens DD2]|uniref:Uncharacterized protein n=1 Tax=Blastococcus saxobsidens (strain DD2) TaxID=1146883 RepID=H6RTG2_BLASD|nr:conserved protein of unknown function [Blastococcus saxobsidens DD2]
MRTHAERIDLHLSVVFGTVDVVVAEGVDAELIGRTVFGDRRVDLAPVQRLAGTPLVVVHAKTVFGDLRLRSLAPGGVGEPVAGVAGPPGRALTSLPGRTGPRSRRAASPASAGCRSSGWCPTGSA